MKIVALLACVLGSVPPPVLAAEAPVVLATRVVRVALFKNGLGVFTREGATPAAPGDAVLAPLPPSVHGSIWLNAPEGVEVEALIGEEAGVAARATSVGDLLRANVGRPLIAHLRGPSTAIVRGTILSVEHPEELDELMRFARRDVASYRSYASLEDKLDTVILEREDGGITAVPVASVEVAELSAPVERTYARPEPRLRLRFSRVRAGRPFTLSYVAKGVAWAPAYRIDLGAGGRARISLSATVVNEAEEIASARVELVTGVPNLRMADVLSPIALYPGLAVFLTTLGQEPSQRRFGPLASQASGTHYAEGSGAGLPSYGAAATATQEDLHLYPLEDVTLAKGSAGWYPLFSETIPYRHLYRWEVPDHVTAEDTYSYRGRREAGGQDDVTSVWHSLRLENTTSAPWTTAPAETVREGTLLGQDVLSYTPRGATTTLRITRAVDVGAEEQETEVKREAQDVNRYAGLFQRVTLRGELRVVNFKGGSIDLEVRKALSGELGATSHTPEVTRTGRGVKRQNPELDLLWRLSLAPGADETITYTYSALVGH